MPGGLLLDYSGYTSAELARLINEASDELKTRIIPDNYEEEELRGGIRPTTQPLNP